MISKVDYALQEIDRVKCDLKKETKSLKNSILEISNNGSSSADTSKCIGVIKDKYYVSLLSGESETIITIPKGACFSISISSLSSRVALYLGSYKVFDLSPTTETISFVAGDSDKEFVVKNTTSSAVASLITYEIVGTDLGEYQKHNIFMSTMYYLGVQYAYINMDGFGYAVGATSEDTIYTTPPYLNKNYNMLDYGFTTEYFIFFFRNVNTENVGLYAPSRAVTTQKAYKTSVFGTFSPNQNIMYYYIYNTEGYLYEYYSTNGSTAYRYKTLTLASGFVPQKVFSTFCFDQKLDKYIIIQDSEKNLILGLSSDGVLVLHDLGIKGDYARMYQKSGVYYLFVFLSSHFYFYTFTPAVSLDLNLVVECDGVTGFQVTSTQYTMYFGDYSRTANLVQ